MKVPRLRQRSARRGAVDEIEDMPIDRAKRSTRPPRSTAEQNLSIIQREIAKRFGSSQKQQAARIVQICFPEDEQTERNVHAVEQWLSDPTRSAMPTGERLATRRRRTKARHENNS